MNTQQGTTRYPAACAVGLIVALLFPLLQGCSGARYEKERAERDANIRDTWALMQRRESQSEAHLDELHAWDRDFAGDREVWAAWLRAEARKQTRRDLRYWSDHAEQRRCWGHKLFDGRGASIEEAWADMIY